MQTGIVRKRIPVGKFIEFCIACDRFVRDEKRNTNEFSELTYNFFYISQVTIKTFTT